MITNITELLNNFASGFGPVSCVIKFPSSNSTIPLFAPIINIVDYSMLDEEIEDEENPGNPYSVHLIRIYYGDNNYMLIKAYWTSSVYYDDDNGKWKQQKAM